MSSQPGGKAYIRVYPDDGIVVSVLMNSDGGDWSTGRLSDQIGELMLEVAPAYLKGVAHLFRLQKQLMESFKAEKEAYEDAKADYLSRKAKAKMIYTASSATL